MTTATIATTYVTPLVSKEISRFTKTVQEVKKLDGPQLRDSGIAEANQKLRPGNDRRKKCSVLPVILKGQTVGTIWRSNQYGIPIKSEYTVQDSGSVMHVEARTLDIRAGHEPEKTVFTIEPSFKVFPSLVH